MKLPFCITRFYLSLTMVFPVRSFSVAYKIKCTTFCISQAGESFEQIFKEHI